jgi:hypothetical protein
MAEVQLTIGVGRSSKEVRHWGRGGIRGSSLRVRRRGMYLYRNEALLHRDEILKSLYSSKVASGRGDGGMHLCD